MPRPIQSIIHLNAMSHNMQVIKDFLTKSTHQPALCAVIKANAYGHDIEHTVNGFAKADMFAVIQMTEAIRLRQYGVKKNILLLAGFYDLEDLNHIDQYQIQTMVHTQFQLDLIKHNPPKHPISIYIKINSEMNRLGFELSELPHIFKQAKIMQDKGYIDQIHFATHFPSSDNLYNNVLPFTDQIFSTLNQMIPKEERKKHIVTLANSATLLRYPNLGHPDYQMVVRAGIISYGLNPFPKSFCAPLPLKPVMELTSQIIAIRSLQAGDPVGYNSQFIAQQPMKIAVVAAGYADGYPREVNKNAYVLVHNTPCTIIGKICMDSMMIDITHLEDVQLFDSVILFGEGVLTADTVAEFSHSIPYTIVSKTTERVICTPNPTKD